MLLDTLALKAVEKSGKTLSEMGSHDVFDLLMDLKDRGLLNFDYESLTVGGVKQFNCPEHTMKHMVREMCRRVLGMNVVNEDMVREVAMRIKAVEDTAAVPAETEEFQYTNPYTGVLEPTIFITLSMATSVAFDAGAPYKAMGLTWAAGENGVSKQVNPGHYEKYDIESINVHGQVWTASLSPGAASSIFNTIDLLAASYGAIKMKNINIKQWTNDSLLDLHVGIYKVGATLIPVEIQASSTVVTAFEPRAADFSGEAWDTWAINNKMFGHINLSSGLVVSWSKGGGDWD